MGLELRGFTDVLALLWNDRMNVYHVQRVPADLPEELPDDGVADTESDAEPDTEAGVADNVMYPEAPDEADIACRISFGNAATPEASPEQREPISLKPTVFCAPDVDVRPGDRIEIYRHHADGTAYRAYVGCAVLSGLPSAYDNHLEFKLDLEGDA